VHRKGEHKPDVVRAGSVEYGWGHSGLESNPLPSKQRVICSAGSFQPNIWTGPRAAGSFREAGALLRLPKPTAPNRDTLSHGRIWPKAYLTAGQACSIPAVLATAAIAFYNAGSMSLPSSRESRLVAREARAGFFTYQTIDYDGRLDIGEGGRVAWFTRRQLIRFLRDNTTVFLDRVWGDGVLFAAYKTGSAPIIDAIPARRGYVVILGLPRRFREGETFEIVTERKIVGAFADEDAYWELAMPAPTRSFDLKVSSRASRSMRAVQIVAPGLRGVDVRQRGRSLRLRVQEPAMYVPYRLEWRWN